MNIHGLKQRLKGARELLNKEKSKPRNHQNHQRIKNLEEGMINNRLKIIKLRQEKRVKK